MLDTKLIMTNADADADSAVLYDEIWDILDIPQSRMSTLLPTLNDHYYLQIDQYKNWPAQQPANCA